MSTGITNDQSVTSFEYTKKSEIIDLSASENTKCPSWANFPYDTQG